MTTQVELRLAGRGGPSGEARAWLLPGGSAAAWLAELCTFAVDPRDVVLLPLPASRASRDPAGAIVVLPAGRVPLAHLRAEPWQCRAGCVLLPASARLAPPVLDDELRALVPGAWLVLHPALGPIVYEAQDVRTMTDLLAVEQRQERWDAAVPGVAAVARLVGVEPVAQPEFEQLFGDAPDRIGSAPPRDLLKLPGDRPARSSQLAGGAAGALARLVLWATRRVPRTASVPTWIDRLEAWARRQRERPLPRADRERRRRELDRLLLLLTDDPERGLRFAMPLGATGGRGVARPRNELGERDADFDARQLDSAGPRDTWDIDPTTWAALRVRYRELANGEIAAGRHRRAAYIFAHLLGDLADAARTLRDGGHHREAAVLFRDRVGNPVEAVRCLVAGGLLADAAALEEELGDFEAVGDLRLLLAQEDLATAAYERAHASLLLRGDGVAAALLRAEKLFAPAAAVQDLEALWTARWQERAFAAWLALATRLHGGEHVAAVLARRDQDGWPDAVEDAIAAAGALASFVAHTGGDGLRAVARDHVRRALARSWGVHGPGARRRLLDALQAVSPADAVLMHDARRALPAVSATARPPGARPTALHRLWQRLAPIPEQDAVVACDRWLVQLDAAGIGLRRHALAADGEIEHAPVRSPAGRQFALHSSSSTRGVLLSRLEVPGRCRVERLDVASWPPTQTLVGVLEGDLVVADDGAVVWTVTTTAPSAVDVRRFSLRGHLLSTETRPDLAFLDRTAPIATVVAGHLVLLCGSMLVVRPPESRWVLLELPARGGSLVRSPEPGNPMVLIGLANGFVAVDVVAARDSRTQVVLGGELIAPTLGWTRAGLVVAVDERRAQTWRRSGDSLRNEHEQPFTSGRPRLILPTAATDEVVFVAAQTLTCFRVG